jgi:hypothetical protein
MGACEGWIAVGGLTREEVVSRLGLLETGESCRAGSRRFKNDEVGIGQLKDGRLLVVSRELFERPEDLEAMSRGASLIVANVEEHVGYDDVYAMADGKLLWRAVCNESGPVETTGTLPKDVAAKFTPDDFEEYGSDAIMEIAQSKSGYRPDETTDAFDEMLDMFHRPKAKKKVKSGGGFFAKFFGIG